jgi:hypothetical protein
VRIVSFPQGETWYVAINPLTIPDVPTTSGRSRETGRASAQGFWSEDSKQWTSQPATAKTFDSREDTQAYIFEHQVELESTEILY